MDPVPGADFGWVAVLDVAGAAVGTSGGRVAIWPAGSSTPRLLSGTDDNADWTVAGIDEPFARLRAFYRGAAERGLAVVLWWD